MLGINAILITGRILNKSIPIGANTELVSIMTRISIISTIVARAAAGIKASMGLVLPEPLVLAAIPLEPPALAFAILEHPRLGFLAPEPPVLAFVLLRPLVLVFTLLG
jgi:hypothetical protein